MRNMRKWMTGLLAVAMLLSLAACSGGEQAPSQAESGGQEVILIADFSSGSEQAEEYDLIQRETRTMEEATPEAMAQALSEWSGLDFTLNSAAVEDGAVTVDWAGWGRHRGLGGKFHPGGRPGRPGAEGGVPLL